MNFPYMYPEKMLNLCRWVADKKDEGRIVMMIDRLGGINPIDNVQKSQNARRVSGTAQSDSIHVSEEAKELSEVYSAMDAVQKAPDVRSERIAEVMEKIKDPAYINKAVVDIVADRILDVYGL